MLSNQEQDQSSPSRPIAAVIGRGHQRQRSTPTVPLLHLQPTAATGYFPETYTRGPLGTPRRSHRRGLSLDPSMHLQDPRLTNKRIPLGTNGMVNTNPGPIYQQQTMREAQMQSMTRPGQQLGNIMENSGMNNMRTDFVPFTSDSEGFPSSFVPTMGMTGIQSRPYKSITTTTRIAPPAFSHTPYSSELSLQPNNIRNSPMNTDLQAMPIMTRGGSFQGSFQESLAMKRSQSQNSAPGAIMSNRNPAILSPAPVTPLDFTNMWNSDFTLRPYESGYESSAYSPTQPSPLAASMLSTPELPSATLFGELVKSAPHLPLNNIDSVPASPKKSRSCSPRKKAAPMPEEMALEDTGITTEAIDSFIDGPDPQTNQYSCLFPECKHRCNRKENIRAHVQTHLGDRKYVCTICNKPFVRPNDLKRHAASHNPNKPHVCICGKTFGRKDAYDRHKLKTKECADGDPRYVEKQQKEEKKRGRPRKVAPRETNERRERKAAMRKQVMEQKRQGSTASSNASVRSSSPEYVPGDNTVSVYSPTGMTLTPPMSPTANRTSHPYPVLESTIASLSLSPPPTRGAEDGQATQDFTADYGSPFGEDHFATESLAGPVTPLESSVYGTPPELDLSSSPAASKFAMDFSDPEFTQSTTASIHNFAELTNTASFGDDFLTDSVLMGQIFQDLTTGAPTDGSKGESLEDFDRYLTFDQM